MHNEQSSDIRLGLHDIWNAFMIKGATLSNHDIPICPTTATSLPKSLISYDDAKTMHNREIKRKNYNYKCSSFIHFFIDDYKFDGKKNSIWTNYGQALSIIEHFAGIIAPDFSTNADFADPVKRFNFYRMNAFGYWISTKNIPVIGNVRWGTKETWEYCFDGNTVNSMLAIGTVASGYRFLRNRQLFEDGFFYFIDKYRPTTLIVYGSANYKCFEQAKAIGINVVEYKSKASLAYLRVKTNV